MKWTKESNLKLKELVKDGKYYSEIAILLGRTISSIKNRCKRLNIKRVYFDEAECKQCGTKFIKYIIDPKVFCNSSCSATYNNSKRIHTEETKQKISNALLNIKHDEVRKQKLRGENNGAWKGGVSFSIKPKQQKKGGKQPKENYKTRKCRFCKVNEIQDKRKIICGKCKEDYYKFYRPLCEFKFDINDFKNKFDFQLVEKFGWYSPANKGNNLNGVSRDHMYSVRDGFINKIDPEIIRHPANCKLMVHPENNKKKVLSSLTLEELLERIKNWD